MHKGPVPGFALLAYSNDQKQTTTSQDKEILGILKKKSLKLDRIDHVDNRPSTNYLHKFVKQNCDT